MSRFDAYLYEGSSRGKGITEDIAKELIGKHCAQAVRAFKSRINNRIYRGLKNGADYIAIDPKNGTRRSIGTMPNYYTFIMSNDKEWKSYPKRSKSLICTTNNADANSYGTEYIVFFYDGAVIGVAPDSDIWWAWKTIKKSIMNYVIEIKGIFNWAYNTEKIVYDKTFKQFKDACKKVDTRYKESDDYEKVYAENIMPSTPSIKYEGDFYKMLVKVFSPSSNGFNLTTVSKIPSQSRELWSDSKAILIREDLIYDVIGTVN